MKEIIDVIVLRYNKKEIVFAKSKIKTYDQLVQQFKKTFELNQNNLSITYQKKNYKIDINSDENYQNCLNSFSYDEDIIIEAKISNEKIKNVEISKNKNSKKDISEKDINNVVKKLNIDDKELEIEKLKKEINELKKKQKETEIKHQKELKLRENKHSNPIL